MRPLHLVPDGTAIRFMRGRFAGVIVSAVLSTLSVLLFFYPGLNLGVDFRGGIAVELRGSQPLQTEVIRRASTVRLRRSPGTGVCCHGKFLSALAIRSRSRTHSDSAARIAEALPNVELRRIDVVGATVSSELFRNGLLATALALAAVLLYIWFRFEWQFGVALVATLILDITKTIGFYGVTRFEFDLNSVAALLTLIGYSVTDKVVVYDRIRENLAKFRTMPLRALIDLSINQTLGRTVNTSLTVILSILPLALIGGEVMRGFGLAIIFGIVIGTSSSIFIANPIVPGRKAVALGAARSPRSNSPAAAQCARLRLIAQNCVTAESRTRQDGICEFRRYLQGAPR
jgi:preprotein translocase subunit SecD/preprotein translocase subunit SecF